MKLRFGWGPVDGAEGMQHNVALVRTVREAVGDDIDVMADAYMGWTLDYAKRMLPLLEPFHLRWLEEPVTPDEIHGYSELKARGQIPIAGGEHEFTLLGFRFAPRLRDLSDQTLYRARRGADYGILAPAFKKDIRDRLIVEHWDDLNRVAGRWGASPVL